MKIRTLGILALAALAATACKKGDDAADKDAKDKTEATAEAKDGEKGKDGAKKKEDKPVPVEVAQVAKRPIQASYHGTAALEKILPHHPRRHGRRLPRRR